MWGLSETDEIRNGIFPNLYSREGNNINLSNQAIKYGEKTDEAPSILPAGGSALTPTSLYATTQAFPSAGEEFDDYRQLVDYQRDTLDGFSIDELDDLFALENPEAKASTLDDVRTARSGFDISISPVLHKDNWRICIPGQALADFSFFRDLNHLRESPVDLAKRPKIFATNGYMDFECEAVWQAMLPAIRLASRVLTNMHAGGILFYDILFHGVREKIDPSRKPANAGPFVYRSPTKVVDAHGYTFSHDNKKVGSHIGVDYRLIVPLISNKLTESERHINTFFLTSTLLHELAHAVVIFREKKANMAKTKGRKLQHYTMKHEPYYQDESISEMGWCGENIIWGGEACIRGPWDQDPRFHDSGTLFTGHQPFPTRERYNRGCIYGNGPMLDNFWAAGVDIVIRSVTTLDFLNDIQARDFWAVVVAKFGCEILRKNEAPFSLHEKTQWSDLKTQIGKKTRRWVKDNQVIRDNEGQRADREDPWWRFRDRRYQRTKSIINKFETRKANEFRAWKRWGKGRHIKNSYGGEWNLDEVIAKIATRQGMSVQDLRKRPRKFVEGLVNRYLTGEGAVPDEFFDFDDDNVLLTKAERDRQEAAIDLDEIVNDVLEEQLEINKIDLMPAIRISQTGGSRKGVNDLVKLVRAELRLMGVSRSYFDEEMNRRMRDQSQIFYIKPTITRYSNRALVKLLFDGVPNRGGFFFAEYMRDCLEIDGYPRNALDGEMQPDEQVVPIPHLNTARQQFAESLNEPLEDIQDMQNRDRIQDLWKQWLVARNHSTNTVFFA